MRARTSPPERRHFTVTEYRRMGVAGVFAPDERVELIEGEIIKMSPINEPHAAGVNRAAYRLNRALGDDVIIAAQNPVVLSDESEPEPDIAVLRFQADFYVTAHPRAEDILLIVEVADTSRRFDLGTKARLYGRNGIPEYWVEDVRGGVLIVHREPTSTGYASVRTMARGETLRPVTFPDRELRVEDLLG